jgi:hypothetical protein
VNEELEQSSFVRIIEHELREMFNLTNVHHLFRSEVGKENPRERRGVLYRSQNRRPEARPKVGYRGSQLASTFLASSEDRYTNWENSYVCPSLSGRIPEHVSHNFVRARGRDICTDYASALSNLECRRLSSSLGAR